VVEVRGKGDLAWVVMTANGAPSTTATHAIAANGRTYRWTGNYAVEGLQPAR
jgi:hypothetical protein